MTRFRSVGAVTDPLTLSVIGAVALTEGIKFLYGQAGDVLRRWRERKRAAADPVSAESAPIESVALHVPAAFEARPSQAQAAIHFDVVQQLEQELREARTLLADYAEGIEPVDAGDARLLEATDLLRQLLEAVYRQPLTFRGERHRPTGPFVEGAVDVDEVRGRVAAVRARVIAKGSVAGSVKAIRVEAGGQVAGVEADIIE
jgi:hypothetical protein